MNNLIIVFNCDPLEIFSYSLSPRSARSAPPLLPRIFPTARLLRRSVGQHDRRRPSGPAFGGQNLLELPETALRDIRDNEIAVIFQNPLSALNPVLSIGTQIAEVVIRHERVSRRVAHRRTLELLDIVRIPEPDRRIDEYP